MIWNFGIVVFLGSWLTGVVLHIAIKRRLKALYPNIHNQLYAKSIIEHNAAKSIKYQKFVLRSSKWSEIDDEKLILWLKLSRYSYLIMIVLITMFLIGIITGAIYYAVTGIK